EKRRSRPCRQRHCCRMFARRGCRDSNRLRRSNKNARPADNRPGKHEWFACTGQTDSSTTRASMTSNVPKVAEPEYKRQLRLPKDEIERIRELAEKGAKAPKTVPHEDVPKSVQAAFGYVSQFQSSTSPLPLSVGGWVSRDPTDEERIALGAACQLL